MHNVNRGDILVAMARLHKYAQHFLRNPQVVSELIGHSNLHKDDLVYDLGAGSGVITIALTQRVREVVAVEIEPSALLKLRQNMQEFDNVQIVEQDILQLETPKVPYKIFSNIPFNLSSGAVRHFIQNPRPPEAIYLVVQKEFARKIVPGDDHFTSQLSAEIGPWFSARVRKPLEKTDFTPPPGVDTVLLELLKRPEPMLELSVAPRYCAFVEQCFTRQKYFTSLNREKVGIASDLRPSQLTLDQWLKLYNRKNSPR